MEITVVKAEKDNQKKENPSESRSEDMELAGESSLSKRLVKKSKPKEMLVLNALLSQCGESCVKQSSFRRILRLKKRMPKHIISLDEKYLRHCLELMYVHAAKTASCSIHERLYCSQTGNFLDSPNALKIGNRYTCDLTKFVFKCPLEVGTGSLVISTAGEWIVGTIMGSKSMMNILNSPLFSKFGVVEGGINFGKTNLSDAKKSVGSNFLSSPGWFSISSSQKLGKKTLLLGNDRHGSETVHKRIVSPSSTNSTLSDQSSSLIPSGFTQAMLQCTLKDGFPHYVFSLDNQKEVYLANLCKAKSPDDKVFDHMYMFHSQDGGRKQHDICTNESALVGRMRVSTTVTLCPDNSEIKETQFVLFGSDEISETDVRSSGLNPKKSKGLSRKMAEVFKTGHPSRERSSFKFTGASTIHENFSGKGSSDLITVPSPLGAVNLSDNQFPPNLELAAIIVKNHIHPTRQEVKIGGWGLKFLKKVESKEGIASLEVPPSESCLRNMNDCSTSVDVLIPAGFHGRPRSRIGGPSSLTERWRSGGLCDCGGWDIGCPLTVLNTRHSKKEVLPQADTQGECQSFDLCIQDSSQGTPIMKMVNVRDRLHFVHFQSTLSALQSFSIAVAILHTQSPVPKPKVYRS
ncbi:uncharacterized protein LOC127812253 [Diospyros lotus]|uniref:uncharacterized protein LOC127812253 n=1 Tax=Diospyros lotus TaxID=55363 RepID=UPI00225877B9|nr:uncharacterized protein LOC127812253 [Diospyros lotus]